MSSFSLPEITADSAQREPHTQRLSFARRAPSASTAAALRQAGKQAPPIDQIERVKRGQRPQQAG
jgi:hypothetical protein